MIETILKMLEDPESCDDEINTFIWVYVNNHKDEDVSFYREIIPHPYGTEEERKSFILNSDQYEYIDYCGSLDAAMSIGAEELEGWTISINQNRDGWYVRLAGRVFIVTPSGRDRIPTMARAICHGRISALDYVRKGKAND